MRNPDDFSGARMDEDCCEGEPMKCALGLLLAAAGVLEFDATTVPVEERRSGRDCACYKAYGVAVGIGTSHSELNRLPDRCRLIRNRVQRGSPVHANKDFVV